ncbi:MAG TPA: type IV pilus secretin PilQ [Nitrospiria bacterium]|nr:type IV pilus secretin PilQ [Nitrospiria bacterium]
MSQWWTRALLSGSMVFALGCAAQSTNLNPEATVDSPIRLHVETPSEGVRLIIEGDTPLVYTAFRLPDPPRLVLDLAGTALAPDQQPIQVNHGSVTTIRPVAGTTGSHTTRIEVGLTQLADYQLRPDGSKLLVTIANPAASSQSDTGASPDPTAAQASEPSGSQGASAAPSDSASTANAALPKPWTDGASSQATAPAAQADHAPGSSDAGGAGASAADTAQPAQTEPAAPSVEKAPVVQAETPPTTSTTPEEDATAITAVHVHHDGAGLTIAIQGNGRFHPAALVLSGPRLVIDLPGTTAKVRSRMAVNTPPLKQIRIGTHQAPQKVRVVFDLTKPVTYTMAQKAGTLTVSLTASSTMQSSMVDPSPNQASTPPSTADPAPAPTAKETSTAEPPTAPAAKETSTAATPAQTSPPAAPTPKQVALPVPTPPKKFINAQMSSSDAGAAHRPAQRSLDLGEKQYTGRLISLDFQDADLDNVLRLMADVSGLNIVVGDGVKGKVTVKLLNVPWDQALDLILRTHGLGQVREGNILHIDTLGNLAKQQDDEAKAKDSATKAEDLITKVLYVNYADAKKLVITLQKHLSPRGEMTFDDRTNTLIVKDISQNIKEISGLLKVLDKRTPQVMIEARIVAADTNFARDLGVAWGGSFSTTSGPYQIGTVTGPTGTVYTGSSSTPTPGFLVNLPATGQAGPLGSLGFTLGRLTNNPIALDLRLSAGETQGVAKTISAPKVMVLDNQKAKIQQGQSVPYVSGATSASGPTTIFVEASLTLEVTPHVTPDGSILMDLHVTNDQPDYTTPNPGGPPIQKKEAKTNVMVKDGDTIVIGGIYISQNSESTSGLPWLNKLPFFSWLFKQTSESNTNHELLVFLVPKIVT